MPDDVKNLVNLAKQVFEALKTEFGDLPETSKAVIAGVIIHVLAENYITHRVPRENPPDDQDPLMVPPLMDVLPDTGGGGPS